jgi:hypothetical protein
MPVKYEVYAQLASARFRVLLACATCSFLAWHEAGFPIDGLEPFRINVIITLAVRERTEATLSSRWQAPSYAVASRGR